MFMLDTIYDFIRNDLIGSTNSAIAEPLANLLTIISIVLIFIILVNFVVWTFKVVGGR